MIVNKTRRDCIVVVVVIFPGTCDSESGTLVKMSIRTTEGINTAWKMSRMKLRDTQVELVEPVWMVTFRARGKRAHTAAAATTAAGLNAE